MAMIPMEYMGGAVLTIAVTADINASTHVGYLTNEDLQAINSNYTNTKYKAISISNGGAKPCAVSNNWTGIMIYAPTTSGSTQFTVFFLDITQV